MCVDSVNYIFCCLFFFFSSRRRHTRFDCDWSSDVALPISSVAAAWSNFASASPKRPISYRAIPSLLSRATSRRAGASKKAPASSGRTGRAGEQWVGGGGGGGRGGRAGRRGGGPKEPAVKRMRARAAAE